MSLKFFLQQNNVDQESIEFLESLEVGKNSSYVIMKKKDVEVYSKRDYKKLQKFTKMEKLSLIDGQEDFFSFPKDVMMRFFIKYGKDNIRDTLCNLPFLVTLYESKNEDQTLELLKSRTNCVI